MTKIFYGFDIKSKCFKLEYNKIEYKLNLEYDENYTIIKYKLYDETGKLLARTYKGIKKVFGIINNFRASESFQTELFGLSYKIRNGAKVNGVLIKNVLEL